MSLSSLITVPPSPEVTLIGIFAVVILILLFWIARLEWRLTRMLSNGDGKHLETSIRTLHDNHGELLRFRTDMERYLVRVEERLRRSVQSVEAMRFNAFRGSGDGGNQSFAATFVNEDGDGVIVSSLYARDRMSVFTKPVSKFSSSYELTEEERTVLEKSRASLTKAP